METLSTQLDKLKEKGYDLNFTIGKDQCLETTEGHKISPDDAHIDETYRIESDSDPMHQTILYAISSKTSDEKGVLVNSYGPYSERDKNKVIQRISGNKEITY